MKLRFFTTCIFLLAIITHSYSQHDGIFIYGNVTTIDGETYTGALRWGKEEIYWTDFFNATKTKNKNLEYLEDTKDDDLTAGKSWTLKWMNWSDSHYSTLHQWVCQFGDLKSLEIVGRNKIVIELKDGKTMNLGDGSNDIGATVKVNDPDMGIVELNWNRIAKVEFLKTPNKLKSKFGDPLYGTVITKGESFTGLIQWDHDERISTDELDGETEDGEFSIKFGKIASIKNEGNESLVKLKSGRELLLGGTNDVDDGNRGIIVTVDGLGRVDISWDEFVEVVFDHIKKVPGPVYNDFKTPKELEGTVCANDGQIASGRIIYDLDEMLDIEIIQGNDDELEYLIPFRNISRIAPKNFDFATVTLKNGKSLLIGEGQDVSDRNDGVLVFTANNENPKYFSWDDLKEITFDKPDSRP